MRRIVLCMFLILIAPSLAGCVSEVEDDHPFAGEWTTIGGLRMVFLESNDVCTSEWKVNNNSTVDSIIDCLDLTDIKTTTTYNYTFVEEVLFMQSIHIEIIQTGQNDTNSDISDITMCSAYVPRDIAPDESTWAAEVNAVSWPSFCAEILGIEN